MPPGKKIDRDALHRYMYRRVDHFGRLKLDLKRLAEDTGIGYYHLSTVISDMTAEGRLHCIAGRTYQRKTYKVEDPAGWLRASGE